MPTSSYMPDVVVEIAWDGGYRIPMSSWTWDDVSDYVELDRGLGITWGRGDERATADANTLTLVLDNSDGRFTAARSTSPYYPDVVLYKPIRVTADPVDGSASVRFVGYITSWPVEWEDTDAYAKATITASSRLARLGLNAGWRSLLEETFLADDPVAYYPLGEPEAATSAADVSGNGVQPLVMVGAGADVVFGQATGPGTDDLTAATFAGGKWLTAPGGVLTLSAATTSYTYDFFFSTTSANTSFGVFGGVTTATLSVAAGFLSFATATSATRVDDGSVHHVALVCTAGAMEVYLNGVDIGTPSFSDSSTSTLAFTVGNGFTGSISHVAAYASALSVARVLEHATAGSTAWAGETTDERMERYANLANIPDAELALDAGSTTMLHIDTSGANVVDMMRLVETTEGGVLFDGRDGLLTFHNRSRRYAATPAVTLDMEEHEVGADYSPRLDASALVNDVTVVNTAGTVSARKVSAASITANGVATASLTTGSDNPDEPLNMAGWALLAGDPKPRVPSMTVEALEQVGKTVTCADVMAVTVGDKVTVTNHPSQASASTSDYFVEGGTETYGPERLTLTWNLSPSSPDDTALVWGDTTQGVWGTNPWAF